MPLGLCGVSRGLDLPAASVLLGDGQGDAGGSIARFGAAAARVRCLALLAVVVVCGNHRPSRQGEGVGHYPVPLRSSPPALSSLVRVGRGEGAGKRRDR